MLVLLQGSAFLATAPPLKEQQNSCTEFTEYLYKYHQGALGK